MRSNIITLRYLSIFLLFAAFLLVLFVPVSGYITNFTLQNELTGISSRMEQGINTVDSVLTTLDLLKISNRDDSRFSVFRSWVFTPPEETELNAINPKLKNREPGIIAVGYSDKIKGC